MRDRNSSGLRLLRAFGIATACAMAASSASAADVCMSEQAKANLAACPGGKLEASPGKKQAVAFKQAPQAISLKKKEAVTKPANPAASMNAAQRDERRSKMKDRSRQLLVTEIQGVESLYGSTPKNSPDRPKLIRRLAEGYVELESAAFRDKTEAQIKADDAKKKNPKAAAGFASEATKAEKVLVAARQQAIKYYTTLKSQYPKWCQNTNAATPSKSTGCGDEVLYYLAYEYEQASQLDDARKVYFELIQGWPQSKYIPNAYLAFGELFFNEAQGDPSKWQLAEQSYSEVTKYPPPENKVWGYAHYKLGYVYWNKEDYARALTEFKKTIEYGTQYAQLPNAEPLAQAARRDIVPVYALSGDPKRAYDFFHPLSGDSAASNEKTFKMMDDLGLNYLDTGHYREGIELYQDLMNRDRGPKYCVYQAHITQATLALKSGNKDGIMNELGRQLEVHNKFISDANADDVKLACSNATAELLTETAMAWHLEAVGSGGVRGTGDKKTMQHAAALYEKVVQTFKQEDFAKFQFPRILKEDWPNVFKIRYAMADLLYFQKDWAKCGPAFDGVVAENPTGPEAPEAAYAAVLCYQNIYTESHKDGSDRKGTGNLPNADRKAAKDDKKQDKSKFQAKEFTVSQKGMLTAFDRYICYIKPKDGDKEAMEQYVEVKYARARTYFEAQRWDEAALAFRDIAINYPNQDVGIYAAQLYLESLNVLGSNVEPPRPSCYDDMESDVPKFIELYCKGGKEKDNADQCGMLIQIQRDIERLKAETLVLAGEKGGVEAPRYYERGADAYMQVWKKYGEGPCEARQPACNRMDEVLYNAAKAYQAARLLAKAISVRKILIDPRYNLQDKEPAKKAVYEIGANYQAIAVYDEAANWFERFARDYPKMEKGPEALQDAVVLRLGLGQQEQAIKDADLFNKSYGTQKSAQAAQIAFAIGAYYVEHEDWDNAKKRLSSAMNQIDKSATFDVQVQAHGLLARVLSKHPKGTGAAGEYNKVRGYWKDPQAAMEKLDKLGGDESEKLRRLAKVLTAVGEAQFFFAEQKRADVDKIKFPEYKGSGQREDVLKHINTKVKDWIAKKRPAIEDAEKEYLKVLELKPVPPPKWVIAAGSRAGQMWGKFVAEFRAAPIPKEWKQNGPSPFGDLSWEEIRGAYYAALDEQSEPQKQMAKGAFKKCLDYSVKYQHFDEYSRSCEVWLSKNYGGEYHLVDEFRGAPNRVNSSVGEPSVPLNMDGTVFRNEQPPAEASPTPKAEPAAPVKEEKKEKKDTKTDKGGRAQLDKAGKASN